MYVNLSKKFITHNILPKLSQAKTGRKPKIQLWRVVKAIIYRLRTGCQWRELPLRSLLGKETIVWESVYYHFNKWSKDGSWEKLSMILLNENKAYLDMSSVQLDGSHTPAKRGGEAVGYQARKKCKTTNSLFLTDKRGIPLAMSTPVSGNHNDLFDIENSFQKILDDLKKADISTKWIFMNADAGFDSAKFRTICFINDIIPNVAINKRNSKNTDNQPFVDTLLYTERFSVERTNAWLDAFKAIINRFETKIHTWMSLHYLAFSLILIRMSF